MLTTVLIDACSNAIIQIDRRPTKLEVGSDGWGVSSVTTFGNLPVCPQPTATRDLHDVPYIVKVQVDDARLTRTVTMTDRDAIERLEVGYIEAAPGKRLAPGGSRRAVAEAGTHTVTVSDATGAHRADVSVKPGTTVIVQ